MSRWLAMPGALPAAPGSYVLELRLEREVRIVAGRLGPLRLGPGRLRYYGSARGPGGLAARIGRHLRPEARRPRWHIDALTACAPVTRVRLELEASEHDLLRRDLGSGRWVVAASGFGSSDCRRCPAHLLAAR